MAPWRCLVVFGRVVRSNALLFETEYFGLLFFLFLFFSFRRIRDAYDKVYGDAVVVLILFIPPLPCRCRQAVGFSFFYSNLPRDFVVSAGLARASHPQVRIQAIGPDMWSPPASPKHGWDLH